MYARKKGINWIGTFIVFDMLWTALMTYQWNKFTLDFHLEDTCANFFCIFKVIFTMLSLVIFIKYWKKDTLQTR